MRIMTPEEAKEIIKSECYIANFLNLDRTRMVNTALDVAIQALDSWEKYSEKLWKQAYDRGYKDGIKYAMKNTELD